MRNYNVPLNTNISRLHFAGSDRVDVRNTKIVAKKHEDKRKQNVNTRTSVCCVNIQAQNSRVRIPNF